MTCLSWRRSRIPEADRDPVYIYIHLSNQGSTCSWHPELVIYSLLKQGLPIHSCTAAPGKGNKSIKRVGLSEHGQDMSLEVRIWIVEYWDCTCDFKGAWLQEPTQFELHMYFACPKYMPQSKSVWQAPRAKYSLQSAQSRRSQCTLPSKFTISRGEAHYRGRHSPYYYCLQGDSLPQSWERPLHHPCMSIGTELWLLFAKLGMLTYHS